MVPPRQAPLDDPEAATTTILQISVHNIMHADGMKKGCNNISRVTVNKWMQAYFEAMKPLKKYFILNGQNCIILLF